jgi:hypothetical protein
MRFGLVGVSTLLALASSGCDAFGDYPFAAELLRRSVRLEALGDCREAEPRLQQLASLTAARSTTWSSEAWRAAAGTLAGGGTNNAERGVDEGDLLQVGDGIAHALPTPSEVVVSRFGTGSTELSRIAVAGRGRELLLAGNHLVVVSEQEPAAADRAIASSDGTSSAATVTTLRIYDASAPERPTLLREVMIDGTLLAVRRIDEVLHVVTRTGALTGGAVPRPTAATAVEAWMPELRERLFRSGIATSAASAPAPCGDAWSAPGATGTSAVVISTLTLDDHRSPVRAATLFGDASMVYADRGAVVVAHDAEPLTDGTPATSLHRFELHGSETASYAGSTQVAGAVLSPFSLSEHDGFLRVVTFEPADQVSELVVIDTAQTATPPSTAPTIDPDSSAPVASTEGAPAAPAATGSADAPGQMAIVGHVTIARQESQHGVRFSAARAWVVTFRQTDPFFVVDLANPTAPRVSGEVTLPGFSTYLQDIGNDVVLGIGVETTSSDNVKLTSFDVSDATWPKVRSSHIEWGATSPALQEHHAVQWVPVWNRAIIPVGGALPGVLTARIDDGWIAGVTTIPAQDLRVGPGALLRAYPVAEHDELVVLSETGLATWDMQRERLAGSVTW